MGVKKQISMLTFVCIKKSTNYNYLCKFLKKKIIIQSSAPLNKPLKKAIHPHKVLN